MSKNKDNKNNPLKGITLKPDPLNVCPEETERIANIMMGKDTKKETDRFLKEMEKNKIKSNIIDVKSPKTFSGIFGGKKEK